MNEYEKFKGLLEYFVAHLEFCVTKNTANRGYTKYIGNITNFIRSGQGHRGQNIQDQINLWYSYSNGAIFININPTVYQGRGCYLNWEDTAINVNAIWRNNGIISLKIVKDSYPIDNAKDILTITAADLGLFDDKRPNTFLKSFFDKFNSLISEHNKEERKKREMEKIDTYIKLLKEVRNLIFTGSPGTGKTFLAKQIARQMIGAKSDEELEQSGQFAFVQFHPSYDYTDFIEGLRPTKPDMNGSIGFELKNGIFKDFCKRAIGVDAITAGHINNFSLADYEKYLKTVGLKDITIKLYKNRIEQLLGKEINAKRAITDVLTYADLEEICENVDDIKDFDVKNNFHNQFSASVSNLINFKDNLLTTQLKATEIKPVFVFVIDEINRGEISKILGEAFFSIDPSYRGKKGAVKTQYSNLHDDENDLFYIPENVYIIGCMNDIDRSVESFDFAMRRRFSWVEISAGQSAENMNLLGEAKKRMSNLNGQISKIEGLNASYHIGGAYFLDSFGNPRSDYEIIWELRLMPLLREYLRSLSDEDEKLEILKIAFFA